jgi:hypothetical protein
MQSKALGQILNTTKSGFYIKKNFPPISWEGVQLLHQELCSFIGDNVPSSGLHWVFHGPSLSWLYTMQHPQAAHPRNNRPPLALGACYFRNPPALWCYHTLLTLLLRNNVSVQMTVWSSLGLTHPSHSFLSRCSNALPCLSTMDRTPYYSPKHN